MKIITKRDAEGIRNCLETLKGYVQLCQSGRLEFALDIPTQIYKLLFDKNKWNDKSSLIERVAETADLLFHPLRTEIVSGLYEYHSPAGVHYFDHGYIRLDLFDLLKQPIELADWANQLIMVSNGVELSIQKFIEVLRDKDSAHFDTGRYIDGIKQLEAAKSVTYREARQEMRQEKILVSIGEYVCRRVEEIVFPSSKSLSEWGFKLIEQKKYEEAIDRFHKAMNLDASSFEAQYGWGHALLQCSRYDDAIVKFAKTVEINPLYVRAYHGWGIALGYMGRTEDAEVKFEEALRINPLYADAWYNWGVTLLQMEKCKKAITKFKKALKIKPDFAEAHYRWGISLVGLNKYEQAIDEFRMAITIFPEFSDVWFDLGLLLDHLGNKVEAGEKFHIARELGCSRSFQFINSYRTVVLTKWIGEGTSDNPRRPQITDLYTLNSSGDLTGAPGWQKSVECPYYGLLVGIDANLPVLDMLLGDGRFPVMYSDKILDPNTTPKNEWIQQLISWFTSEGMPTLEGNVLKENLDGLSLGEIANKIDELLKTPKAGHLLSAQPQNVG